MLLLLDSLQTDTTKLNWQPQEMQKYKNTKQEQHLRVVLMRLLCIYMHTAVKTEKAKPQKLQRFKNTSFWSISGMEN